MKKNDFEKRQQTTKNNKKKTCKFPSIGRVKDINVPEYEKRVFFAFILIRNLFNISLHVG